MKPAARIFMVPLRLFLPIALSVVLAACTNTEPDGDIETPPRLADTGKNAGAEHDPGAARKPKAEPIPKGVRYYRIREGDTLYSIGMRSGIDFHKLAKWNGIQAPYKIYTGQKIKLFNAQQPKYKSMQPTAKLPETTPKVSDQVQKSRNESQKKLTLSIDNRIVLKFYCEWPIHGKVLKNFSQSGNKGIDIATEIGQPIKAAASGKVVYSGQGLLGYGNLLIIKHNEEFLSAYGNNSKLLAKEGEEVEVGRIIAEAGKGSGDRASLHFEIRKNGKPVNPIEYLPDR
jgi:lipoprotein NlpD